MRDKIIHDHHHDGIDRRGFLKCMAWAGTGVLWTVCGGVLQSYAMDKVISGQVAPAKGELSFVQISDSHIGFSKEANKDVVGTLPVAIDRINGLATRPCTTVFIP
jgi:hypothetical protein